MRRKDFDVECTGSHFPVIIIFPNYFLFFYDHSESCALLRKSAIVCERGKIPLSHSCENKIHKKRSVFT